MKAPIDIYDFDRTIYDGNSAVDFYVFCLMRQPGLVKYLPYQLWHLIFFIIKIENRKAYKSRFFIFLHGLNDTEASVELFWESRSSSIKEWYRQGDHAQDVIVSASPEFLLGPICSKMKVHRLIATSMNSTTGSISGANCYGNEKVARLKQAFPHLIVRRAYSDSLSDLPVMELGKEAFVVQGSKILALAEYRSLPYFKKLFLKFAAL